jgi:anaerobic selenocysteine-containing dehydrogenase
VLDAAFIAEHTHGFDEFARGDARPRLDGARTRLGLTRQAMEAAAAVYARSQQVIAVYGMGLTQHVGGVDNVHMVTNLLLLRGNLGKRGAGVCAVRGHSNVQGQRTVGITEKPELAPLDRLAGAVRVRAAALAGPHDGRGLGSDGRGEVTAFLALGGNFVRAAPDTAFAERAWRRPRLTVSVATKLNRSHVLHGEAIAFLLPCLGRIEVDRQATGPQAVSMESSVRTSTARGATRSRSARRCCPSRRSSRNSRRRRCRRTRRCRGTTGSPTTRESATRSRRPTRTCSGTTTGGCSSRAGSRGRCRRASAGGKRTRSARTSSRRGSCSRA